MAFHRPTRSGDLANFSTDLTGAATSATTLSTSAEFSVSGSAAVWSPLKIGAGGYLTGMDIASDGTMVVRTDTYGAYIWNGTVWQQLVTAESMPSSEVSPNTNFGKGVYEICIAPSDSNVLYMQYLGSVYRSDDKGLNWEKTSFLPVASNANDANRIDGQKMAIDPNNPNVIYVGTQQDGLFVSKDGGATWASISPVPEGIKDSDGLFPGITGIAFDPSSGTVGDTTKVIYASSYGNGVYKSIDGGLSWKQLAGGPVNVQDATISPTGVYYAIGNDNTSLWQYKNDTWVKLYGDAQRIAEVTIDPFNPSHIVITQPGGSLQESFDGGVTWGGWNWAHQFNATDVPWLETVEPYMSIGAVAFDPLVPGKLWTSAGVGVWNTDLPSHFKFNTPIIWNSQSIGIEQLVANDIIVAPGGQPVLASWDRAFFYVSDLDAYPSSYSSVGTKQFSMGWSVDYASSDPSFIVGISDWWGTEQSGYSLDGGKTWHTFSAFPDFAGKAIGGTIAASSPDNIIWAPANKFAPYYTLDGGETWKPVELPGVTDWSMFHWAYYLDKTTVTADRVLENTFYMYYVGTSATGVYKTSDGGVTWTKTFSGEISPFSTFNSKIEAVPGEAGHLFFTGGPQTGNNPANQSFYQSTDGGATWTPIPNVLEVSTFGYGAAATPDGYPAIYIVGWVNGVYGIYQSNDAAKSWIQIGTYPNDSLDPIKTISGDPDIYGQVYIGFSGSGYAYLPAAGTGSSNTNLPPTDIAITANSVGEGANIGTVVGTLNTADPTSGDAFTYSLLDSAGGRFSLNGNQLIVANGAAIDYETAKSYAVIVQVKDSAGNTYQETLTIGVTNNTADDPQPNLAPTDLQLSNTSVVESAANGTVVGNLTTLDPTTGETFTYTLLDSAGGRFSINGNQLIVANGAAIDYETAKSYTVTLQVKDSAGNTYQETLTIGVNNNTADDPSSFDWEIITKSGSAGNNTLAGTSNKDWIQGLGGDDTIRGRGNSDKLDGGNGHDRLSGGTGNDLLLGGDGNDTLIGGIGADTLDGGQGVDTVSYSNSTAAVRIDLTLSDAAGGDAQGDKISNFENVIGSTFADTLVGSEADNTVDGGGGDDTIIDGNGDDRLIGGAGNDRIILGNGVDALVFGHESGDDVIENFRVGTDFLQLKQGVTVTSIAEYDSDKDNIPDSTIITLSTGSTLTLLGLSKVSQAELLQDRTVAPSHSNVVAHASSEIAPPLNADDRSAQHQGPLTFGLESADEILENFLLGTDRIELTDGVGISHILELDADNDSKIDSTGITLSTGATLTLIGVTGISSETELLKQQTNYDRLDNNPDLISQEPHAILADAFSSSDISFQPQYINHNGAAGVDRSALFAEGRVQGFHHPDSTLELLDNLPPISALLDLSRDLPIPSGEVHKFDLETVKVVHQDYSQISHHGINDILQSIAQDFDIQPAPT